MLALAGCARGQPDFAYARSSDPLYGALLTARENLSDLSRYRDRPAQAARAFGQYEFITAELQDRPDFVVLPAGVQPQLDRGGKELRDTLGITPGTPPREVAAALDRFAAALDAGRRQEAMRALSQPFFTRGPQDTFETLNNPPPMPEVEAAASSLAIGPPGASEAAVQQRLHRRRLQQGAISVWRR